MENLPIQAENKDSLHTDKDFLFLKNYFRWLRFLKPTPYSVLLLILLSLLKYPVMGSLLMLPGLAGGILVVVMLVVYMPVYMLPWGWGPDTITETNYYVMKAQTSFVELIYIYCIASLITLPLSRRFPRGWHTRFGRGMHYFTMVFVLVWVVSLIPLPRKDAQRMQPIDYGELARPSRHFSSIFTAPAADINLFPRVVFVELDRKIQSRSLIPVNRMLDGLFPDVFGSIILPPAYRYTIEQGQVIVGPDVACTDIRDVSLLIGNGWNDKLVPASSFPQSFSDEGAFREIQLDMREVLPDGSVEITMDGQQVIIPPGQEYQKETEKKGLTDGSATIWKVRNFGSVAVQCYPEFVYDVQEKDWKLVKAAREQADESYCLQISTQSGKTSCFQDLFAHITQEAIEASDVSFCQKIRPGGVNLYAMCVKDVAVETQRSDFCIHIPDTERNLLNMCYAGTQRSEACGTLLDRAENDRCFYSLHRCESIEDKQTSDECYVGYLHEIWERMGVEQAQQVCETIGPTRVNPASFNREVCYQELVWGMAGKHPEAAVALVEAVRDNPERQGIMYQLIAREVTKTNLEYARLICNNIMVNTQYASKSQCLQGVR